MRSHLSDGKYGETWADTPRALISEVLATQKDVTVRITASRKSIVSTSAGS